MSEDGFAARQFLLLGAGGLFLAFDLALSVALSASMAVSRVALRRIGAEGGARLAFLEKMQDVASRHRSAAALARQLSLLTTTLFLGLAAAEAGWSFPWVAAVVCAAVVGVLLAETVVAGAIALWHPRLALRVTAAPVRVATATMFFLVEPIHRILEWVAARQLPSDDERGDEQDQEVEALIEVGEREGLLEAEEGEMMRSIVELDETTVREIMTPRTDIVALPVDCSVERARHTIQEAGHSRIPVYRNSVDNVVGVLHARDLFRAWEEGGEQRSIARYLRPATFVPESRTAADLLADMRQQTHLSMVVDEYGGIAGLVTLEDLLEEIVGEITDEHEPEEQPIRPEADGSYVINAVTHVGELESLFGVEFEERDFDTVGGLVVFGFGRVPSAGEVLELRGLRFEVLQAERRRVHQVRVRRIADAGEAGLRA